MPVSYGFCKQRCRKEFIGLQCLIVDFVERRDAVVPFEQRGGVAGALDRSFIKLPHGIDHRVVVRIEDVFAVLGMPRDVNLRDAIGAERC